MVHPHANGSILLLEEIDKELARKSIPNRERLMLRVMRYLLQDVPNTRAKIEQVEKDVKELERNSILMIAKRSPRNAAMVVLAIFVANSLVNWQGIRRPILQALIHATTGMLVPIDVLP